MNKINSKKGFTLIELLVVVAIIGILASVVLTSLNTARNKGKDASVQSSMSSMRASAELGVDSAGTYVDDICTLTTTGGIGTLVTAVNSAASPNTVSCGQNTADGTRPTAWGAAVLLPTQTGTNTFCVDSTGFAGTTTGVTPANEIAAGYSSADVVCAGS